MRKLAYLAPFVVAIFTVTSLYAANASRLSPWQMLVPLIFALCVAGIFLLLFWLLKWTSKAAPFVASVFTISFLIWYVAPYPVFIFVMVGSILMAIYANRKQPNVQTNVSILISFLGIVSIIFSTGQGLFAYLNVQKDRTVEAAEYVKIEGQPNIYFIVPDRMPSPAAMRETGIDPDGLINDLTALGFYVPEDNLSHDTYTAINPPKVYSTRTMRYFASVLNNGMDIPLDIPYKDCRKLIRQSEVFGTLHEQGYTITNVASWFSETANLPTADYNLKFADVSLLEKIFQDELSVAYFERTILAGLNLRVLETGASQKKVEQARHKWQADQLIKVASSGDTSQFVMAHLMLPHEPFVYSESKDQREQYYDQIRFAMDYLYELASKLRQLDPDAFIIIQSDEGMAYRKPAELNYGLSNTQWNGVFTAWYLPMRLDNIEQIRHTDVLSSLLRKVGIIP